MPEPTVKVRMKENARAGLRIAGWCARDRLGWRVGYRKGDHHDTHPLLVWSAYWCWRETRCPA